VPARRAEPGAPVPSASARAACTTPTAQGPTHPTERRAPRRSGTPSAPGTRTPAPSRDTPRSRASPRWPGRPLVPGFDTGPGCGHGLSRDGSRTARGPSAPASRRSRRCLIPARPNAYIRTGACSTCFLRAGLRALDFDRYRNLSPDLACPGSPNSAASGPGRFLEEPGPAPAPARSRQIRLI